MIRDETNRKLAEWLGWTYYAHSKDLVLHAELARPGEATAEGIAYCAKYGKHQRPMSELPARLQSQLPDFYTDESANALLLDKMPEPMLMRDGNTWKCAVKDGAFSMDSDRKTAICEAVLQMIAKPTAEKSKEKN